ncbi:retinal guanylyl cyclase 2-like [Aplochiton taeniatus]
MVHKAPATPHPACLPFHPANTPGQPHSLPPPSTSQPRTSALYPPWWLLRMLLFLLCLPRAWCYGDEYHRAGPSPQRGVFKVGVLGPWACDPLFTKALPQMAATLAVDRINHDPSLSLGVTFQCVILEEDCKTSLALQSFLGHFPKANVFLGPVNPGYCDAASLLARSWNKALFSWSCLNYELDDRQRHRAFARTVPSPVGVLAALASYFRWAHIGIVSSSEDLWVDTACQVANGLRTYGLPVITEVSTNNEPASIRKALARIKKAHNLRMIILCMHSALIGGQTQRLLLETALDMHLLDGGLVFVPYDTLLYSLPYHQERWPPLVNNSKLRRAYDAVLTVTMESQENSFHEAYQRAVETGQLPRHTTLHELSPLFGTIYSSVLFVANAMQNARDSGAWLSGANLVQHSSNMVFHGFSQRVRTNRSGSSLVDYVVLDTDGLTWPLAPTHRIDLEAGVVRPLGHAIHFPGGAQPEAEANCWFGKTLCTGGKRRRINQIRLVRGPDKIMLTLDDVTFINPSLSNKKLSIDEGKLSEHSEISITSVPATHENSNIAIYEGDWVWMKKLPTTNLRSITSQTSDVFELMKDIRQENVNLFLGFFMDGGVFGIITEFCSRGSMQDLLRNDDFKLDWMFKSSLILDLIKSASHMNGARQDQSSPPDFNLSDVDPETLNLSSLSLDQHPSGPAETTGEEARGPTSTEQSPSDVNRLGDLSVKNSNSRSSDSGLFRSPPSAPWIRSLRRASGASPGTEGLPAVDYD